MDKNELIGEFALAESPSVLVAAEASLEVAANPPASKLAPTIDGVPVASTVVLAVGFVPTPSTIGDASATCAAFCVLRDGQADNVRTKATAPKTLCELRVG